MLPIPSNLFSLPLSEPTHPGITGFLSGKVILIISPQHWGDMLLAKHHYAIALAQRGNEVYFLNPPDNDHWSLRRGEKRIRIEQTAAYPNLFLVRQQLFFPYNLKFHSRGLYDILIKTQIRDVLRVISRPVDILWSFDLGNLFPLSFFDGRLFKIFHPVDEPGDRNAINAGAGADVLFSVTREILGKYESFNIPSYLINHGLADEFLGIENPPVSRNSQIRIGMSGNLLRRDLDRKILLQIIRENPEAVFQFYGSYTTSQSNIGAASDHEAEQFIGELKSIPQVVLRGVLKTPDLAKELNQMDALLICYDVKLDQSKGTNYHKVMEYLSTGKVIISNNITAYSKGPDLVRMIAERSDNSTLPALFRNTISNLERWNAAALVAERKSFAYDNTYQKQLERINVCICDLVEGTTHAGDKTLDLLNNG